MSIYSNQDHKMCYKFRSIMSNIEHDIYIYIYIYIVFLQVGIRVLSVMMLWFYNQYYNIIFNSNWTFLIF